MSVVSRVRRWLDPPEESYELQKMTHRGGWRRELGPVDDPEELPDRGDMSGNSGRYRVLKREDGDFAEVVWSWESQDSGDFYRKQRHLEEIREELHDVRTMINESQ